MVEKLQKHKKQLLIIGGVILAVLLFLLIGSLIRKSVNPIYGTWKCGQSSTTLDIKTAKFEWYATNHNTYFMDGKFKVKEDGRNYILILTSTNRRLEGITYKEKYEVEYSVEFTDKDKIIMTNKTASTKYSCERK